MVGGNKKNALVDDYISEYVAENGRVIACKHGFTNWSERWYEVDSLCFDTLKEAKAYCEA